MEKRVKTNILKSVDDTTEATNFMIRYINSLFNSYYQEIFNLNFEIIENKLFLYTEMGNGRVLNKDNLYLDVSDIDEFYLNFYKKLKDNYVDHERIKISLLKIFNLNDQCEPYLTFRLSDIHSNFINISLRTSKVLNEIENDWIDLVNNKKKTKIKCNL